MRQILGLAVVLTLAMAIAPQPAAAQNPLGGAILGGAAGAIIGGVAGGGQGAAIGAGIGAATGAIIAAQGEPRGGGYYYYRRGCYIRRPYGWVRVAPRYCYSRPYYYRRAPVYEQDIAETQRLLNELGYDAGPVDGQMGPATRHAIRSFQRDAGLPITGEFDFALLNRLRSTQSHGIASSPPPPSSGLDCRTATTATEGAICASPELTALDQQLTTAYRAAIAGSDVSAAARLRNAQRQWILNRNSCGADTACIATAYRNRIAALKMYAPPPVAGDSSHSPQAAGSAHDGAADGDVNAAPAAPAELHAMRLLYGPSYTRRGSVVKTPDARGVRVNKGPGYHHTITEYVIPWKTATLTLDGTPYFIATGQGHSVSDPRDPKGASHAQPAYISAIWFTWKAGHWTMAGKEMNLTADGSFGQVVGKPWTPFPKIVLLQHAAVLVADESGWMQGGDAFSWFPIYEFTATGLRALGDLPSGEDNTGAGTAPVISYKGKFMSATMDAHGFPKITLNFSGKDEIRHKPVDLHDVPCTFDYQIDPGKPQGSFKPTTPGCAE